MNYPWSNRDASYKNTLSYLHKRSLGQITSFKTPWPMINKICADGIEVHTSLAICSRPAVGKSIILEQLCREIYSLNKDKNFRILKFQLEMMPRVIDIREFSAILGKSYGYICSADGQNLSKDELMRCWNYVKEKLDNPDVGSPQNIVTDAPTVSQMGEIIDRYMETYKQETGEYTTTIVAIDHARKVLKQNNESEQQMLHELATMLDNKKKKYPIIVILLGHLKREINTDARCEAGKYGNYIRDEDVYGGDAIFQAFDAIIGIDRPSLRQITRYGPKYYIIDDPDLLVFHYLKVRNGTPGMSFYKGLYEQMRIVEIEVPAVATARLYSQQNYNNKPQNQTLFNNENK